MKFAIIGSGISGLTAAYLLNRNHDITVYESNDYVGGHTHTHEIVLNGKKWAVDTGFIVYNERTYPNFIKLLDQLKVERQLTSMGFSVKSSQKDLEYAGNSINGLFAQRSNILRPSFIRMLRSILRFNSEAEHHLDNLEEFVTLGDYLSLYNYPEEFINDFIIPMGAAIWSTKPVNMMKMPAIFFIQFFRNHGLLAVKNRPNWWVIKGGSKCYVEKMTISFNDKIRIATPVKKVKRNERSIEVIYGKTSQESETFDAVIFATHSDQALSLLEKPSVQEVKILEALQYQKNEALLHLDESILPKRKLAWASWNYLLDQNPEEPVALTYNMNILQSLNSDHTFCVTLNNHDAIDPSKVIKKIIYHHPLYTVDAIKAQSRKHEISGQKNTYYCGAYWHNGFHEDGVVSALDVCEHFGEKL